MPNCIVAGCLNSARNNFGVRLRKPDTNAIWAQNTDAFICDMHASMGFKITVQLESIPQKVVSSEVTAGGHTARRTTDIQKTP